MTLSYYKSLGDRVRKIFDQKIGQSGQYLKYLGNSTSPDTRQNIATYDTAIDVVLRIKKFSIYELDVLSKSGIAQFDAAWVMRTTYASEVKPNDILITSSEEYQVIPEGVRYNDDLHLEWLIMTRRR